MKQKLVASIKRRMGLEIPPRSQINFLKKLDVETIVEIAISTVYLYTRAQKGQKSHILMSGVISAIGHAVRSRYKLPVDSSIAAKTGGFLLYSFQELGMIFVELGKGPNGHATYLVKVVDDASISKLFESIKPGKVEKLPSLTPYADWTTCVHACGAKMIKTNNREVLKITAETHPIVFECVNKAQHTGWRINNSVYGIYLWALRNRTDAFSDVWDTQNPEARQSKIREAKTIYDMATRFLHSTFYHLYYLDFRGRKYPATAYLHEQGSDLAKGMLLRHDKKPIGKSGFFWLMVSIANNWAGDAGREDGAKTDKIPLQARFDWAMDNEEILLSYAEAPKVNQGWMKADKPWQFIAACFELYSLRKWQSSMTAVTRIDNFSNYDYESSLECFIDGTNNGSQHLSALTRDEITAPHVNLTPSELPGDLYNYVATYVWERLEKQLSETPPGDIVASEQLIEKLIEMKKEIYDAGFSAEKRKPLLDRIRQYRQEHEDLINKTAHVFWCKIKDIKQRRKIVKRNVMTLPYGGTPYGLGEQQINDARKHGIDLLIYLENKWSSFMGRTVFEVCKEYLKRPMRLLSVFEEAGKKAESEGRFLKWNVPVTDFPVVQNYTEGVSKKIWVQYGPPEGMRLNTGYFINTYQILICFIEDVVPSKHKQSQGASPNAIHSLDAAHLMLTVNKCDFSVTTIHDSYGALLADVDKLFVNVRESFVDLYASDPLKSLMEQIGGDVSQVEIGTLDVSSILDSEYAFC